MATTSPYGGTTSLPQYLQQRTTAKTFNPFGQNAGDAMPKPATQPTVTPPTSSPTPTAPTAAPAPAPSAPVGPVSSTGNPTIPAAPAPFNPFGQNAAPAVGSVAPKPTAPAAPKPNVDPAATKPPAATVPDTAAPVPASPPEPASIAPGTTGQNAPGDPIALQNLQGLLERLLGNPNRYSTSLVDSLRQQGVNRLDDQRKLEEDRLRADAASRGVFYGSPLTNSLGDVSERYVRGLAENETNVLKQVADAQAQDQQNAINNVFTFGQGQQNEQQLRAYILNLLAQMGSAGGPTIPGAVGDFGTLPQPGTVDNAALYELLGSIFAPKPATAKAA